MGRGEVFCGGIFLEFLRDFSGGEESVRGGGGGRVFCLPEKSYRIYVHVHKIWISIFLMLVRIKTVLVEIG